MDLATRPSVLFVYFTYTNQTRKVIDAMAEVLRGRDVDVTLAAIEFTDPRYAGRFGGQVRSLLSLLSYLGGARVSVSPPSSLRLTICRARSWIRSSRL